MLQIGTFYWHDPNYRWGGLYRYTPEHVNRLYRGIERNTTLPFEFFCITDIPEGLDPRIRIIPLWNDLREMGGCFLRLKAFSEEMRDVIGERFALVDIDCVVTGNVDPIFARDDDFIIWSHNGNYCASMFMMNAGCRREVWEDFDPIESPKLGTIEGTDQRWIHHKIPGESMWTPADGVYNVVRAWDLPQNARMVFFPGKRDPSTLVNRVGWIRQHWV